MAITIGDELEAQARELARAEGLTVEAYLERLIREDQDWREHTEEPLDETHPEFENVHSAVVEALDEAERGEGKHAADTFAELRAKHGISR